jgi:very-short-patch-repair endonuclease
MDWKSAKGFAAMCLILSCLGAEGEYVLWDDATSEEMTEKEWRKRKFGSSDKPPFRHRVCEEVVTSTCITNLQRDLKRGRSIGCSCNSNHHWRHRRPEVVQYGNERGFEVLTTEEEWADECDGKDYCPTFKCVKCKEVVTSTCIHTLQRGKSIGCGCKKKTEAKLRPWLEKKFSEATVNTQYRGPKTDRKGQTHFDFHLTFPDRFEVLIELDGVHHFWSDAKFYTNEACERDLTKEKWAIAKGHSVVRVLQEDVWNDLNGWQGWLTEKIEAARSGEPRVFIPIAPEYLSVNSAYVQLRSPGWGWADLGELRPIFRLTPVACTV